MNPDKQFNDILRLNTEAERRQIAAMAMQGLLSSANRLTKDGENVPMTTENVAIVSVLYADALIAELDKNKDNGE